MIEFISKFDIAKYASMNNKDEADAISKYTDFITKIKESELSDTEKSEIIAVVEEIIADELNHQSRLEEIYVYLTDIKENKE
jgi:hypothetical protein